MLNGKRVLAVVPARSGSKGIPDKNMQLLDGVSLIGRAGQTLARVPTIDARVISTDSPAYAEEGRRFGLDAPFLRPAALSTDQAGAVETMQHALREAERHYRATFDVVLIIEPTSPLRLPEDIVRVAHRLIESGADSVVTVTRLNPKYHPRKILTVEDGHIRFNVPGGNDVKARQQLTRELYWRNGVCYALTRRCLMEMAVIFTDRTLADVIERPIVNIDDPDELEWAAFLLESDPVGRYLKTIFKEGQAPAKKDDHEQRRMPGTALSEETKMAIPRHRHK